MMKTTLSMVVLVLLAAFASKTPPVEPEPVDLCYLLSHPPEHRGHLVRTAGTLRAGFEVFGLWAACSDRELSGEVCLFMEDTVPAASVAVGRMSQAPEVVAVSEISEREFLKRLANDGQEATLQSISWSSIDVQPVSPRRDDGWRELHELAKSGSMMEKDVALVGRFEYVNRPSMFRHEDGSYSFVNGYGHMNTTCSAQLVVSEVLAITDVNQQWEL